MFTTSLGNKPFQVVSMSTKKSWR